MLWGECKALRFEGMPHLRLTEWGVLHLSFGNRQMQDLGKLASPINSFRLNPKPKIRMT